MEMKRIESVMAGLKYDISRLQVRVLALEGKKEAPEVESVVQMPEADALFWCRINQARIAFTKEGVSVSVNHEGSRRVFVGKGLMEAVCEAREFVEASKAESIFVEEVEENVATLW